MRIREIELVSNNKIGHVQRNGGFTESHEDSTILYLTQFGFDVELIKPSNTKKSNNPDVLIMGAIWEIKSPMSSNPNTIKNRFRKASKQASKVIFDLRYIKNNADKVKEQLIDMLKSNGKVRRMMIIERNGKLLDIIK